MARLNTEAASSEYYPPRARWFSRLLHPWFAVHRRLHLEKIHLPSGLSCVQMILGLFIPGYAFLCHGRRVWGWAFLAAYCLAALVFIIALGYLIGGVAYGLMISVHASSIIYLESRWLRADCRFQYRLALAAVSLAAVGLAFYLPLGSFVRDRWLVPLRVKEHVVIVQRLFRPSAVKPGDLVMYSIDADNLGDGHRGGAVRIESGFGCGPVLAVTGDRIEFATNTFSINGVERPSLPHMPGSGELVVPEKHWFVWPQLAISGNGNVGEAAISTMMLNLAMVSEGQYAGKPFKHWFGRRQILP